jgi:hypothetical protein
MSNRAFLIFAGALIAAGVVFGHWLAGRPTFSVPNVLNLLGILYDITAVIVLYETFAKEVKFRTLAVSVVAPAILWAHMLVPMGVALSGFITRGTPHGAAVAGFAVSVWVYSILPLSVLDAAVVFPKISAWQPIDMRYRRFGFFLLFSGLVIQFVSAAISL